MKKHIGFIGGGNMGTAILSRICRQYPVAVCEKRSNQSAGVAAEIPY